MEQNPWMDAKPMSDRRGASSISDSIKDNIIKQYSNGVSVTKLRSTHRISQAIIHQILKDRGIHIRNLSESVRSKLLDEPELVVLYENGWTQDDLVDRYHIDYKTLVKVLNENDVKLRTLSEAHTVYKIAEKYVVRTKSGHGLGQRGMQHKWFKKVVFDAYGGKCVMCLLSGEDNYCFLCLDHINNDGKYRRYLGEFIGKELYKRIFDDLLLGKNIPNHLQLLCYNCNLIKDLDIRAKSDYHQYALRRSNRYKIKLDTFNHYSNNTMICKCCGYSDIRALTIDHIDAMNKTTFIYGSKLYSWLKRNNYPDGYQLLCMNCNGAKRNNDFCPHRKEHISNVNI